MAPVVLFGAFDRHNVGDLLFPHVAAALLPGVPVRHAGLAERDFRAQGGVAVQPITTLRASGEGSAPRVLHVGGEVLTCSAWEAAVMLLEPDEVQPVVAWLEGRPDARRDWVRRRLGIDDLAPYVLGRDARFGAGRIAHAAVGGVALERADAALRDEVIAKLREADCVTVRDRHTQAQLQAAGIAARLLPDPVSLVAELFGARIARRGESGEVARVRAALPHGHLAVQISAEFGDDATLDALAVQLDRIAAASGLGLALYRAGAAPWHDDVAVHHRLAARLRAATVVWFESLDVWDICALIATSGGSVGSSLHGRIVAMAYARPRINLHRDADATAIDKQRAYAATWEAPGLPASVRVGQLADAAAVALAADPADLAATARRLAADYRTGFDAVRAALD